MDYSSDKWILGGVLLFVAFRLLRFWRVRGELPKLMAEGAVIVDVRSPAEFASGANPKSINIPLDQMESRASTLDPKKPVVVCCASGTRSAMAARILQGKGFAQVTTAGPWRNTLSTQ
jgi:rhodanese-related sulfurtransferase